MWIEKSCKNLWMRFRTYINTDTGTMRIKDIVKEVLKEDTGRRDITTELTVPADKTAAAMILVNEDCVVCGLEVAKLVFKTADKKIKFRPLTGDGRYVKKGKILARIEGRARSILTAERVALNFLMLLSGIATKTKKFVDAIKPYKVKILDTRKTTPGLRELQKYAVRAGGGYNHRMSLDKMVLIKDNHLKAASYKRSAVSLKKIIKQIRNRLPARTKIEIEVRNLGEFVEALKAKPDIIMLDNMSINEIKKAVQLRNNLQPTTYNLQPKLEASGRVNLKNIKKIAACGIDMISIGELTHSIDSVDISLEIL